MKANFQSTLLLTATLLCAFALPAIANEACGLPASWEYHKTITEVALQAGLIIAGIIVAAYGAMSLKDRKLFLVLGAIAAIVGISLFVSAPPLNFELIGFGHEGSAHEHADFAVFINGAQQNFSLSKYMTIETGLPKSGLAHLHEGIGTVMHKHATGVTLSYFFKTLGWMLNNTCIVNDENVSYCNEGNRGAQGGSNGKTLTLFINGNKLENVEAYSPNDLDRILVAYGNYSSQQLQATQSQVTNYACVYSQKCEAPAGVVLPPENCFA